ncbi:NAD(P)/FAD-dependent oxidoreductase [Cellvibrio japonicus]|uniref:Oxidoreductase, FAD-binding n=1 Tax=Cellvibrio japonicus (strain Ueda107) TaxID=498211 RepID=B3PK85_CELJU|nr:FAD-dependent oxidoreductase [Cellvibrio japonicus]ACE83325.1 oxidoreductase, FAD-binding [Cellvibrio japonicus Ueda107]QEI11403.1 FAD-dependent oxidoreductase [Cellvibrio japonicus]QEI14977.1 FAD-dependent oxidoreductase [Cellvibrio japonicus]QEI18557.1 FAD-dependent oxidoreductase [Cellvibrio japonicus]
MSNSLPDSAIHTLQLDLAIIGGGVAGLWLANRAKSAGYELALFESHGLGSGQTLASQGMIHGGMKYTLAGALTGASEAIADMPRYWRDCLCGEGEVNLRHTRILSDHFFMWSTQSLGSKLTGFLASKLTRGRVDTVSDDRRPPLLRHKEFNGSLYRLEDLVIDTPSLVANLANNVAGRCVALDWNNAHLERTAAGDVQLHINHPQNGTIRIQANCFVFCAGQGNAELLRKLNLDSPAMQLRPLQQVMVKHTQPFDFYGHCLGAETTPRLTISSHRLPLGERIWYLGGSLAERGASLDADDLIALAKQELAELLPWVDLTHAEWATLPINRAEPRQPGLTRPDKAFVAPAKGATNLLVAWPTKLTLAPNLASETLTQLPAPLGLPKVNPGEWLPLAPIAKTPWELAFPPAISTEERLALMFPEADDDEEFA